MLAALEACLSTKGELKEFRLAAGDDKEHAMTMLITMVDAAVDDTEIAAQPAQAHCPR